MNIIFLRFHHVKPVKGGIKRVAVSNKNTRRRIFNSQFSCTIKKGLQVEDIVYKYIDFFLLFMDILENTKQHKKCKKGHPHKWLIVLYMMMA